MADPGGPGEACDPLLDFFYKNEVYERKMSIKQVRNLSQNAENSHFRDLNFKTFWGSMPPQPLER